MAPALCSRTVDLARLTWMLALDAVRGLATNRSTCHPQPAPSRAAYGLVFVSSRLGLGCCVVCTAVVLPAPPRQRRTLCLDTSPLVRPVLSIGPASLLSRYIAAMTIRLAWGPHVPGAPNRSNPTAQTMCNTKSSRLPWSRVRLPCPPPPEPGGLNIRGLRVCLVVAP